MREQTPGMNINLISSCQVFSSSPVPAGIPAGECASVIRRLVDRACQGHVCDFLVIHTDGVGFSDLQLGGREDRLGVIPAHEGLQKGFAALIPQGYDRSRALSLGVG